MIPALETIKAILWNDWDPIGVRGIDANWPRDEYDGYALPIWIMLKRSASIDDIEAYLHASETEHMGLSHPSGRARKVAEQIAALDAA